MAVRTRSSATRRIVIRKSRDILPHMVYQVDAPEPGVVQARSSIRLPFAGGGPRPRRPALFEEAVQLRRDLAAREPDRYTPQGVGKVR